MPKLIIQSQNQEWSVDLAEGSNVLGRSSRCTIPIHDANLSREHCEVLLSGAVATVLDRGSMNGTLVNGKRVSQHRLQPGDKIAIGQTFIWFESKRSETERRKAPSEVVKRPDAYDSRAATRRTAPAAPPKAAPAVATARAEPRAAAVPDYSLGGGGSGGGLKAVAGLLVLGAIAGAVYFGRGFLSGGGGPREDKDNLLARNPSFELEEAGRPVAWSLRGKGAGGLSVDATQGRNRGRCLVLERKAAPGELVAECEFDEDFTLGKSVAVEASAYAKLEGFSGAVSLKVEWLRGAKGVVLAEEFSPPARGGSDWTLLQATFNPPAGAGAFRFVLAAVGRGGRVAFDDAAVRLRAGDAPKEQRLGNHRVAWTPQGVLQIETRGRRSLANVQVRLESEKEGSLGQALATDVAASPEPARLVFKGNLVNPVDFRGVGFEQRVEAETTVRYVFSPGALKQIDRVTIACTLPRVERVQGVPERADQLTGRISFESDEGEIVLESVPARVRTERVRGGLRVYHTFAVDGQASEAAFGILVRDSGRGVSRLDPFEEARKKRQERLYGEALDLLRRHVKEIQEAAKREGVQADIRNLEELERREWEDVKARAFQAWYTRRAELVNAALEAVDLHEQRWPGEEFAGKADTLREETRKLHGADAEADRPRVLFDRAKQFADSGRKSLARGMLEVVVSRWPSSDVAADAQQLLKTLGQ